MSKRELSPAVEVMPEPKEPGHLIVLRTAKSIIEDEEGWCKGYEHWTDFCGNNAYCMIGALNVASEDVHNSGVAEIEDTAAHLRVQAVIGYIDLFNDDPSTTHADVMAAFDLAIEQGTKDWLKSK